MHIDPTDQIEQKKSKYIMERNNPKAHWFQMKEGRQIELELSKKSLDSSSASLVREGKIK